jgi:hypothetical protein
MDDFTKGLGTKLMLLLWHEAMESPRDHLPARLIARVVDGLRSDSFEHEAGLAEIAREFAGWYHGSPDQDLAAQFASDLLRVVAADTDAEEFLKRVDKAKASITKLRLSPDAIRRKKEELERSKRRALSLLQRIREGTKRQLKQSQVEPGAPPNRRPPRSRPSRSHKKGGGR